MGQFKELMEDLTFTDGVADAKLIRERIHNYPIATDAWDYEKTLKNLFMILSSSDRGASAVKGKFQTLVTVSLDDYNCSGSTLREDCAFLVAKVFLHRKEDEFNFKVNWRDLTALEHSYIKSFSMELLLPEKKMMSRLSRMSSNDPKRLTYDEIVTYYGVTVETAYNRMKELDLL